MILSGIRAAVYGKCGGFLNAFLKVLNKFDAILEEVIQEYEVDTLQVKGYAPDKKELLLEILRFERLLLEHSMNRKVFNSYDVRIYAPSIDQ